MLYYRKLHILLASVKNRKLSSGQIRFSLTLTEASSVPISNREEERKTILRKNELSFQTLETQPQENGRKRRARTLPVRSSLRRGHDSRPQRPHACSILRISSSHRQTGRTEIFSFAFFFFCSNCVFSTLIRHTPTCAKRSLTP